ncbi:hypothetical protein [Streptomyces sp. NPDC003006]
MEHRREAGLGALADLGFVGLDNTPEADPDDPVIVTGFKATGARKLNPGQKQADWQILTKLGIAATGATALLRALLVLTNLESNR